MAYLDSNRPFLSLGNPVKRTISSGVIDVTGVSYVAIETEGGASTDDLTTMTGGVRGQIICIEAFDATHDIVIKDRTTTAPDLINMSGDFTMDTTRDAVMLIFGAQNNWNLISESSN